MLTEEDRKIKFAQYQKEYLKRPEVKLQRAKYYKMYIQTPERREHVREYQHEYNSKPEIKLRNSNYQKLYRQSKKGKDKIKETRCKTELRRHHDLLKDDPERLTTEFLTKLLGVSCKKHNPLVNEQ